MKFFDLHNDLITGKTDKDCISEEISRNAESEAVVVYAVWATRLSGAEFSEKLSFLSRNAGIFAIEDAGAHAVTSYLTAPRKPAYCSLTWNYDNALAGGASGESDLTAEGRDFIKILNKQNIAVDLAHLNRRSFYSALSIADRPVVSHCGFAPCRAHPRNITREQAELVVEKNGIVGLSPVPEFTLNGDKDGFFAALYAFIEMFGCANLAVGTDFYGCNSISGLESYDLLVSELYCRLARRYGEKTAEAVLYENARRFFGGLAP